MTSKAFKLLTIAVAFLLAVPAAASAEGKLNPIEQAYVDEIREERPDQADRMDRKFKDIDGRNVDRPTKDRLKKKYIEERISDLETELRLIKKVGNKQQAAGTQATLDMLRRWRQSYMPLETIPPKRVRDRMAENRRREKEEEQKGGRSPEGGQKSVSIRGGINLGITNVSAKGDLETTTASGNLSGSNGLTNPFLGMQMTIMLHNFAIQTAAFSQVTPILHFYAAQNLGGFGKVIAANLHPGGGRDSFLRFKRGFQAGVALGFAMALTDAGLCGFGSSNGCMDLTLWAGPLIASMATRVITDETGGGGNYNSFTRNDTMLGAMLGMQFSYLACATCQLPVYLTLGGQLNFAGSPDSAGGRTSPFNFDYAGSVGSYTEALFWVGVAFQLDQVFRAITSDPGAY